MNEHLLHWLGRIANSVSGLVTNDCDMTDVTGTQAAAVMEEFARIERMAAIGKMKAAARVAETPAWQGGGDRDAAGWFARKTGSSKRDAERSLAAAKALEDLDATKAAAERGDRETTEAYAADALAEAICGGGAAGAEPAGEEAGGPAKPKWPARPNRARASRDIKVIVRIDHSAYERGHTVAGETCDIAGAGQVPVSTVKEVMGDAFLAAIVTDGHEVLTVAHLGRAANAYQQTALEFTQPSCQVEGCWRTGFLQTDHRTGWATTHTTVLEDLDRLCETHHALKTNHGWKLEPGRGKRRFRSPKEQQER